MKILKGIGAVIAGVVTLGIFFFGRSYLAYIHNQRNSK